MDTVDEPSLDIRRFSFYNAAMQQPLLTSDEVAEILKVSRTSVYLMMKRGDFPIVRIGRVIRVRPEDLERYIHNKATRDDADMQSICDGD